MKGFEELHRIDEHRDLVARRRYGIIETRDGQFHALHLRPIPKLISWPELMWVPWKYHARGPANRCLLYYNQPRRHGNFLSLKYVVSTEATPYRTLVAALRVLDRIAEIKRSDALLCDASNRRISDRLMRRHGWEPHAPSRFHRNYIKRFYGQWSGKPTRGTKAESAETNRFDRELLPLANSLE